MKNRWKRDENGRFVVEPGSSMLLKTSSRPRRCAETYRENSIEHFKDNQWATKTIGHAFRIDEDRPLKQLKIMQNPPNSMPKWPKMTWNDPKIGSQTGFPGRWCPARAPLRPGSVAVTPWRSAPWRRRSDDHLGRPRGRWSHRSWAGKMMISPHLRWIFAHVPLFSMVFS